MIIIKYEKDYMIMKNIFEKNPQYIGYPIILLLLVFNQPLSAFFSSIGSSSVDICECLTNSSYYNSNEQSCDKAINKELGHNWKTTNYSQEPYKDAKFDALTNRCK